MSLLKFKSGVRPRVPNRVQGHIIAVVAPVYFNHGLDCVVTELDRLRAEGTPLSLHHVGRAVDFRLNHTDRATAGRIEREVKAALGEGFDVLAHGEGLSFHLHAEYDPRQR